MATTNRRYGNKSKFGINKHTYMAINQIYA